MKTKLNHLFQCLLVVLFLSQSADAYAQAFYADAKGVLREKKSNKEVSFYGVNYTLPFAHAYRMHKALGVDLKKAIDKDVYHFSRLGFNAYRIHVWDVEISDSTGALKENEHLDLLDYLVYKLKERDIKVLFTPMAYWGNGYPERDDTNLSGFSAKWNKQNITKEEPAIVAQERYLKQFVSHVNPYTGVAYKDESDIVGFEINNEPNNDTKPALTTAYVNRMVKAIRSTGCKAPLFYNVSHNFQNTQAFYNAQIDGGTFQWYPTGLVAGRTRKGNFLPATDVYPIPFGNIKNFDKKVRVVYEFDAADIADPYIYPAVARSFRTAGFQWITQFAYDPLEMAWANTEYQTHFLNLAYTPGKAISMKIAAEVVRQVPRLKDYGYYPLDTVFDAFRVSYNEKLSEMNTTTQFMYSNTTQTQPKDARSLTEIAGCGSSPVVAYEGMGAYFLDKLSDGIWRLEIMPDAVWLEDPFAKPSLKRQAAAVLWNEHPMTIRIPNLRDDFTYEATNDGNTRKGNAREAVIQAYPGVYLLIRKDTKNTDWKGDSKWGAIRIKEFVAPESNLCSFAVLHQPAKAITEGSDYKISAKVVGPTLPDSVCVFTNRSSMRRAVPLAMKRTAGYMYELTIPGERMLPSSLNYTIAIYHNGKALTFPANVEGIPMDWDYYSSADWSVLVEPKEQFITLLEAHADFNTIETYMIKGAFVLKTINTGASPEDKRTLINARELKPENRIVVRSYIKDKTDGRFNDLPACKQLYLKTGEVIGISELEVGFVTTDGYTYKFETSVKANALLEIPLDKLVAGKTILRPTAYPSFLPDYFTPKTEIPFDIRKIEFLEITTKEGQSTEHPAFEIKSAWLK
jgi:hypothetical protein